MAWHPAARRTVRWYVAADFMLGPLVAVNIPLFVAAWAAGIVLIVLGVPAPVGVVVIGLGWAALVLLDYRAVRWVLSWASR